MGHGFRNLPYFVSLSSIDACLRDKANYFVVSGKLKWWILELINWYAAYTKPISTNEANRGERCMVTKNMIVWRLEFVKILTI